MWWLRRSVSLTSNILTKWICMNRGLSVTVGPQLGPQDRNQTYIHTIRCTERLSPVLPRRCTCTRIPAITDDGDGFRKHFTTPLPHQNRLIILGTVSVYLTESLWPTRAAVFFYSTKLQLCTHVKPHHVILPCCMTVSFLLNLILRF